MTAEQYNAMADKIRSHRWGVAAVTMVSRLIVWITMGSYLLLLGILFWQMEYKALYHSALVPAVAFVVVSLFRRFFDAKRPYEMMEIRPLIVKDKAGQSFPSRHVFSSFIIGMAVLQTYPWWGMILLILGVLLAVLRVVGGVHYTRDVIAGAAIGLLSGILGFYVIF